MRPRPEPPRLVAVPSLDQIAADPSLAEHLPAPTIRGLRARALVVLNALLLSEPAHDAVPAVPEERLLSVKEAAQRLATSADWLYRNADNLPFTVRVGGGQLRFSSPGAWGVDRTAVWQ